MGEARIKAGVWVSAALRLMHVHGYHATSLDDVLRESGIGKGNFYLEVQDHGLAEQGGVAEAELLRTFNCGVGMIAIVRPDAVDEVSDVFAASGESVARLGEVVEAAGKARVVYHGHLDLAR